MFKYVAFVNTSEGGLTWLTTSSCDRIIALDHGARADRFVGIEPNPPLIASPLLSDNNFVSVFFHLFQVYLFYERVASYVANCNGIHMKFTQIKTPPAGGVFTSHTS
jgi:hypothetical protein